MQSKIPFIRFNKNIALWARKTAQQVKALVTTGEDRPELNSWNPHKRRRKLTSISWSLTPTCTL